MFPFSAVRRTVLRVSKALSRHSFAAALVLACALVGLSLFARARRTAPSAAAPAGSAPAVTHTEGLLSVPAQAAETILVPPLNDYTVVGPFSPLAPVWWDDLGHYAVHTGLDLSAGASAPVFAPASGEVLRVYRDALMGWTAELSANLNGHALLIRLSGLAPSPLPRAGQRVRAGEALGQLGEAPAEACLGAHLHLETIQDGETIDPAALLP